MKNTINKMEVIVAIAVTMAFVMPVTVVANDEKTTNNSEIAAKINSADLCPSLRYNAEYTDITLDTSNFGVLGDRFYGYRAYPAPLGPIYFDSDNPGSITLLAPTISPDFIAGGTWAEDTWYGCQYDAGWLWTIDEVTGAMAKIGREWPLGLNGLAYNPTTGLMYGASRNDLYAINMSTGEQTLVGSFNTDGLIVGIAFDDEGTLYAEDIATDCLYSVNTLTGALTLIGPLGIDLNYAQDMAYDIDNDILYLAAYISSGGQLYTCNVTTGKVTRVGAFQGGAEITGFAIPYTYSLPPEPELEIGNITGGIFKIKADIKNIGNASATNVDWSIVLDGGFILLGGNSTGTIVNLSAGATEQVQSEMIFGFGGFLRPIEITVTATIPESSATVKRNASVFLFFIF